MQNNSKELKPFNIYGVYRKSFDKILPPFMMSMDDKACIDYYNTQFNSIYDDIQKQVQEKKIKDIESARAGFIDSVQDTCIIKIAVWDTSKQEFINEKNIICDFKDFKKEIEVVDSEKCSS